MSARRGFAVGAGLERDVARKLAVRCEALGYGSLWSSDSGAADGLETLAALAEGSPRLELGVATLELDRRSPAEIATELTGLGLEPGRLWLAIGPGLGERSAEALEAARGELRERLGRVRLVLATSGGDVGPLCELAGRAWDGALLEWTTPTGAAEARARTRAAAEAGGRAAPPVVGSVRSAVGADAETRLARDEGFYRELHDGYRAHFERLGESPGSVGVQSERGEEIGPALAEYEPALDLLVVRALARAELAPLERLAAAAAPVEQG